VLRDTQLQMVRMNALSCKKDSSIVMIKVLIKLSAKNNETALRLIPR
jgi:hypothetical protein